MTVERAVSVPAIESAGPAACLSLDLDNEWAYLKTHGDPAWESYPSYLDLAVPRMLSLLERRGLRITFFIVGQDASLEKNRDALVSIARAGHEIGNHSLRHEPWMHLYTDAELEHEIGEAERHIDAVTGQRPVGFRGPGFSISRAILRVLLRRGYVYDASTLPSFLGPVARAYYLATGRFDAQQRERLRGLFGDWREGLRPLKPYRWRIGDQTLLEMPVTTFPGVRVPIHLTYVMFLATVSHVLARAYFNAALQLCRVSGIEPSILLHPLDFLGGDEVSSLRFFPSMTLNAGEKRAMLERCLDVLQRRFAVRTLGEHAAIVAARDRVAILDLPER